MSGAMGACTHTTAHLRPRRIFNRGRPSKQTCRSKPLRFRHLAGRFIVETTPPASRRLRGFDLRIFASTIGVIVLLPIVSSAQSDARLIGCVYDKSDGSPVITAQVELVGTNYSTKIDERGCFVFEQIPVGIYRVAVSDFGYKDYLSNVLRVEVDIARSVDIALDRKLHRVDDIRVSGSQLMLESDRVAVLDRDQIPIARPSNLADLLETIEGINVQRTGGSSGEARVSIRGSDPRHVLVLLDGQKINASGSGVADLNTIPVEIIERVEVHKGGGAAEFGPEALAGVINIITQPQLGIGPQTYTGEHRRGQWSIESLKLSCDNVVASDHLTTRMAVSSQKAVGDFPFTYNVSPVDTVIEGIRINNRSQATSLFAAATMRLGRYSQLSCSGQAYRSEHGLPGRAATQNESASQEDDRDLLTARWSHDWSVRSNVQARLGYSRFYQHFEDRDNVPASRFDTEYDNTVWDAQITNRVAPFRWNQLVVGLQFRHDHLDHADLLRPTWSMGETTRKSRAIFVSDKQNFDISSLGLASELSLDAAVRYDLAETDKEPTSLLDQMGGHRVEHWSPRVGMSLSRRGQVTWIARASYGKSLQLPAINALFWKNDAVSRGNPGLRPEQSEHSEAGIEAHTGSGPIQIRAGLTYFHSYVSDLIVWAQGYQNVWRPENIAAAMLVGHEDFITLSFSDRLLELSYQNTITTSRNRSGTQAVRDRDLTFTPHYITNLAVRLNHSFLYGSYSVRLVGKRYSLPNNQKYFDAYRLDDLMLGLRLQPWRSWEVDVNLRVNNLRDESYVLISHFPMPGREFEFGLRVTFGLGDNSPNTQQSNAATERN